MNQFNRPANLSFSPSLHLIDDHVSNGRYLKCSWFRRWRVKARSEISTTWWKLIVTFLLRRNQWNCRRYLKFLLEKGEEFRGEKNKEIINRELDIYGQFFDQVEKTPLTVEQRRAAIIFEDRNLLVAAAGSGKTSSLIGKVGYAIKRGLYEPNEMLVLAFNKNAAEELNQRIQDRLKPWLNGQTVKAHTFHALGKAVIRKVSRSRGERVRVADPKGEKTRMLTALNALKQDKDFLSDWVMFRTIYGVPLLPDEAFNSKEDYDKYIERQRENKRNGEAVTFKTLSGDVVRSGEELRIANWLFINGVPFEYERQFDHIPENWDKYEPDFYYPDINVWHEHFALDDQGKAPAHFDENYAKQAEEKRQLLSNIVWGRWFETQSRQCRDGNLFKYLKDTLEHFGQPFRLLSADEIESRIKEIGKTDDLDLLLKMLPLIKGNFIDRKAYAQLAEKTHDTERALWFAKVFWPLHDAYNKILAEECKIDFDDMIVQASQHLEQGRFHSPYKLILVDEFQDISPGRARLVKALLASQEESVLFGVGDDWQAINGFAGSDLQLFMEFEKTFGHTREEMLTMTFRHPQGVADVGAHFVMQNTVGQKPKKIISKFDEEINGLVDLVDVYKDDDLNAELNRQLARLRDRHIAEHSLSETFRTTVYLLSRYGLDKTKGLSPHWLEGARKQFGNALNIEFKTMHQSKGLEADYVFLLGLNAGSGLTFPSTMTNDPLVDMLLTRHDLFPYAEERRLLYVALTRAKKRSTIIFRQFSPSPFVLELLDTYYAGRVTYHGGELPMPCECCGKGFLVPRRSEKYGPFLGCTRYSAGCKNTRRLPINDQ